MTNAQLNKSVKNMANAIKDGSLDGHSAEAQKLFTTLTGADNSFKAFTAASLRILIVLNRRYHYVKSHDFGPADY